MSNNLTKPLVSNPSRIRLAMLGMVQGNGHPYSWSAIINGRYDAKVMAECGYPIIPKYLGAQPPEAMGIDGAQVTHIWCDQRRDAEQVASAAFIENVVDLPTDVIGKVDAVVISTDIGSEHVERARPFIEAGLPVYIDKPLTDNEPDLQQFAQWWAQGHAILSSSCMRYATEFHALRGRMDEVGEVRLIVGTMMKSWERYGIHAIESVYGLLPPNGWQDVVNTGDAARNIVHLRHANGVDVILPVIADMNGGFGRVTVIGTRGILRTDFDDTFNAFKNQLVAWVDYLRTGISPIPYEQTIEQMKIVIAGIRSRQDQGRHVSLSEIKL